MKLCADSNTVSTILQRESVIIETIFCFVLTIFSFTMLHKIIIFYEIFIFQNLYTVRSATDANFSGPRGQHLFGSKFPGVNKILEAQQFWGPTFLS